MPAKKLRVFRCVKCSNIVQASHDITKQDREDRCNFSHGYYGYCSYEELVPKKARKKKR